MKAKVVKDVDVDDDFNLKEEVKARVRVRVDPYCCHYPPCHGLHQPGNPGSHRMCKRCPDTGAVAHQRESDYKFLRICKNAP